MAAQKGLYLDGTSVSLPNGAITFANNIELDNNMLTYVNADGFEIQTEITGITHIIGKIQLPNGVVLFGKHHMSDVDYIIWYDLINGRLVIRKSISNTLFKFSIDRPITGVYTFNYLNELIITFSDGVDSPSPIRYINLSTIGTFPTPIEMDNTVLNPECIAPNITVNRRNGGNLPKGTYQFAIRYRLANYVTSCSVLTPVRTMINDSTTDTSDMHAPSNGYINLDITTLDTRYRNYDLIIVHNSVDVKKAYVIKDVSIYTTHHDIKSLTYPTLPLEEVLVRTVAITKGDTFAVNKGNLLIANIKYQDHTLANAIMQGAINDSKISTSTAYKSGDNHLHPEEYYLMYVGAYDNNSNFINAYLLNNLTGNSVVPYHSRSAVVRTSYGDSNGTISFNLEQFHAKIREIDKNHIIGGICLLFAEHNESNSVILAEAPFIRDGYFFHDNDYFNQFTHPKSIRLYPFEYLFNPRSSISCKIAVKDWTGSAFAEVWPDDFGDPERHDGGANTYNCGFHGTASSDPVQSFMLRSTTMSSVVTLDYVYPLNEASGNLQGDTYYRLDGEIHTTAFIVGANESDSKNPLFPHFNRKNTDVDNRVWNSFPSETTGVDRFTDLCVWRKGVAYIINPIYTANCDPSVLYGDLYNQKLIVATSTISLNPKASSVSFIVPINGDAYRGRFGVKVKCPARWFDITHPEEGNGAGTKSHNTNMIILQSLITSKLNVNARFTKSQTGDTIILGSSTGNTNRQALSVNYKYDTFINDERGKTYDYSANALGVEMYPIYNPNTQRTISAFPNRIVRSEVISSESLTEGWRIFRPLNYTDVDLTKGAIVAIQSSDSKLYIQSQYGLKVSSIKDVLSNSDTSMTYLGTGDLFDRVPVEILYSPNGYIGCNHKLHTHYCLFGYILIDIENKRIFNINDGGTLCISDPYSQQWFRDNMRVDDTISIGVDEFKKVMYITVIRKGYAYNSVYYDSNGFDNGFTISYNFVSKSWVSFFNYIPQTSFFIDTLYTIPINEGNIDWSRKIFKQVPNRKGIFYDAIRYTQIKTLFSHPNEGRKLTKAIMWDTEHVSPNGVVNMDKTFDRIFIHSDIQATDSDYINIDNTTREWFNTDNGSNKLNLFTYNNIWDIVNDKSKPIIKDMLTSMKPIDSNLNTNLSWFEKSKMIGRFVYVALTYYNQDPTATLNINRIMNNDTHDYR